MLKRSQDNDPALSGVALVSWTDSDCHCLLNDHRARIGGWFMVLDLVVGSQNYSVGLAVLGVSETKDDGFGMFLTTKGQTNMQTERRGRTNNVCNGGESASSKYQIKPTSDREQGITKSHNRMSCGRRKQQDPTSTKSPRAHTAQVTGSRHWRQALMGHRHITKSLDGTECSKRTEPINPSNKGDK